jgi:hypothetical protein
MDMYNKLFPLVKSAFTFDDTDKSENSQVELSNRSFLASCKLKFGLEWPWIIQHLKRFNYTYVLKITPSSRRLLNEN